MQQTDRRQTKASLNVPAYYGRGHNNKTIRIILINKDHEAIETFVNNYNTRMEFFKQYPRYTAITKMNRFLLS